MQDHAVRRNARRPHSDNGTKAAIRGPRHHGLKQLSATLNSRQRPVVQRAVTIKKKGISEEDKRKIDGEFATFKNEAAKAQAQTIYEGWINDQKTRDFVDVEKVINAIRGFYNKAEKNRTVPAAASASAAPVTARRSPLFYLTSKDMDHWRGDNPEFRKLISGAHHKFPKSALGWIYDHMTPAQRGQLNTGLGLDPAAGKMALARLRSNLISPNPRAAPASASASASASAAASASAETSTTDRPKAFSDHRIDDPHNNLDNALEGEEDLDLMHQTDGHLTPRSAHYKSLAHSIGQRLLDASTQATKEGQPYFIPDDVFSEILDHVTEAERLHRLIEGENAHFPSHHLHGAFEVATAAGESVKYRKTLVPPIDLDALERRAAATASSPAPNAANAAPRDEKGKRDRSPKETQMQDFDGNVSKPKKHRTDDDD